MQYDALNQIQRALLLALQLAYVVQRNDRHLFLAVQVFALREHDAP